MNRFSMIFLHYFKRAFRDVKEVALLLGIPVGLIIVNSMFAGDIALELNGYNVIASHIAPAMLLSFQFFNGFMMFYLFYHDFKGAMRWRLHAAPCSLRTYIFPAFAANWAFSILLGLVIIVISAVFLNVYWGNLFVLAAVLLLTSLMAVLVAVLIYLFTQKIGAANALGYLISFGMMILSGFMLPLEVFGINPVTTFLSNYGTPLSLGAGAIINSGQLSGILPEGILLPGASVGGDGMEQVLTNIGILVVITLVLAIVAAIAGRRRAF